MKLLTIGWLICLLCAVWVGDVEALALTSDDLHDLRTLPMESNIIVLWQNSKHLEGAIHSVTVNYTSRHEQYTTVKQGLVIAHVTLSQLQEICVEAVDHDDRHIVRCLKQPELNASLSMTDLTAKIVITAENGDLHSRWTDSDPLEKTYTGIWISGLAHQATLVHESHVSESVLQQYDPCQRYHFYLYGTLKNGTWVMMGQEKYFQENATFQDLDAFPLHGSIMVTWRKSELCSVGDGQLTISSEDFFMRKSIDLSKAGALIKTDVKNQTYHVTIEAHKNGHNQLMADFSRSFLFSFDPNLSSPLVEFTERNTVVQWIRKPNHSVPVVLLWIRNANLYKMELVGPETTSIKLPPLAACTVDDLVMIEQFVSGQRINIGSIVLSEDLTIGNMADAFLVSKALIVMWNPLHTCPQTKIILTYSNNTSTYDWHGDHGQMIFYPIKPATSMNITFLPYHFSIERTFELDTTLLTDKKVQFAHSFIKFTWKMKPSNASELLILWFVNGELVHLQFNTPDTWNALLRTPDTCMKHTVSVIQAFESGLRVDTGHTIIQGGVPIVKKISVTGTHALIHWELNHMCTPVAFNLRWTTEPKGTPPTVNYPSANQVLISNLEDCNHYEFQLVASYPNEHDSVSGPVRLNISLATKRLKPDLSITNGILTVQWEPVSKCQLARSVVTLVRNEDAHKTTQIHAPNVAKCTFTQLVKPSTYSVTVTLVHTNDFTIHSEISTIRYVQQPQLELHLKGELTGQSLHLRWMMPMGEALLFYRIDALYNTKENFTMITADHALFVPLVHTADSLNVIVSAVFDDEKKIQSNLLTVHPKKVPPQPSPPMWEKSDSHFVIRWDPAPNHSEYKYHLFVSNSRGSVIQTINVAPNSHEYHLHEEQCLKAGCFVALQAENRYGKSVQSVRVQLP